MRFAVLLLSVLSTSSLSLRADTAKALSQQIPALSALFGKKDKGQSTPSMPGSQGIYARDCLIFVVENPDAKTVELDKAQYTYDAGKKKLFRELIDPKYYASSYFETWDVEKTSCMPAGGKMPSGFNTSYSQIHEESSMGMIETCYLRAVNKKIVACPIKACLTGYLPILKAEGEMNAAAGPITGRDGKWKSDADISRDPNEVKRLKDAYQNARATWEHLKAEWEYKQNDEYCGLR